MKTLNEIVAEQIRKHREAMGISQRELANRIGAANNTIVNYWEASRYCPNAASLCLLADVFGCSVDELLGR